MIAFECAVRDFDNLLTEPRTVSNTYTQVARRQLCANRVLHRISCNISIAYHVQHVICQVIGRDSSAINLQSLYRIYLRWVFLLFVCLLVCFLFGCGFFGVFFGGGCFFFFFFFFLLKPLTDEEGEVTGVLGENP